MVYINNVSLMVVIFCIGPSAEIYKLYTNIIKCNV